MDPKKQLAQIMAATAAVVNGAKAAGRDITESGLASLEQKDEEAARLQKSIDMHDRGSAIIDLLEQGDDGDSEGSSAKASFLNVNATARSVAQKAIGRSWASSSSAVSSRSTARARRCCRRSPRFVAAAPSTSTCVRPAAR